MTLPVALDTNLLVRLLTNDDPEQARCVADLIDASSACFVPITVVLELEWVLRGPGQIRSRLRGQGRRAGAHSRGAAALSSLPPASRGGCTQMPGRISKFVSTGAISEACSGWSCSTSSWKPRESFGALESLIS